MSEARARTVALLLFDEVEVLDFAGPFEVFAVTGQREGPGPFRVVTVAGHAPVRARNGLRVAPDYGLDEAPPADLLVIPGGYGTRPALHDAALIEWIRRRAGAASLTLSVCTGSLLLAKAGLLAGRGATTHHNALHLLGELAPDARVHPEARIVDNGPVVCAGGISAGIDAALYVVARLLGPEAAAETARFMEYRWEPERLALAEPTGAGARPGA